MKKVFKTKEGKRKFRGYRHPEVDKNPVTFFPDKSISNQDNSNEIVIYTDGGCEPNPGRGAWAFVCLNPYTERIGLDQDTTSNKMELTAVINAIKFGLSLPVDKCKIKIYSDSQYVVKGFNEWMHNWVKRGWMNAYNEPTKNIDLWKQLYSLKEHASLFWIRGHNGNQYNEICDNLVRSSYQEAFGNKMKY